MYDGVGQTNRIVVA